MQAMRLFTYIDNSNLFIEGQRLSAASEGLAADIYDAMNRQVFNYRWNIDYGKLHAYLESQGHELVYAKLWGSIPPKDSFWDMVKQKGFQVTRFERSPAGEKKVDVAIAHQLTKDAYTGVITKQDSIVILLGGDRDFVPVVEDLRNEQFDIRVAFWSHAASRELKETASHFINLDPQLEVIRGVGPRT